MRQEIYKEVSDGIFIERVVRDYEFTMPTKHFHEEYELYYLVKGERYFFIDTKYYHIKEGSLVFINRNSIHKTSTCNCPYHDRINIELHHEPFSSFLDFTGEIALEPFFSKYQGVLNLEPKEQTYVYHLLNKIATEIKNNDSGSHIYIMCRLTELFIFAKRKFDTLKYPITSDGNVVSTTHQKVADVASYIATHYTTSLSLTSLAQHFFINKSYLSRIFKEVTGYTITEYIHIARIQAAKKLLTQDDLSILEVATAVGYGNLTYFERVFNKITETSPLKYRKQFHRMNQEVRPKTYKSEKM